MNPEVKQKWIDALRSGKYSQGKSRLRKGDNFCGLGVLCDIYDPSKWIEVNPNDARYQYYGEAGTLPEEVQIWAELQDSNPMIIYNGQSKIISILNDHFDLSFEQLAQLIEEQL